MNQFVTGRRLSFLRKDKGLSPAELSKETGVSQPCIDAYEWGAFRDEAFDRKNLATLAKYFGVEKSYILGEDESNANAVSPSTEKPISRFARILKNMREKRGLTQEKLAEELGVNKGIIEAYETDYFIPSIGVVATLERYFGVTAAALLGLEDAAPAAIRADEPDRPLPLADTEARLLRDFRCLSAENQATLLRLAAKFAAIDKAFNDWLDADEPC